MTIENIPKILLHIHLDGSLDVHLVDEWLKEDGYDYSLEEVINLLQVSKECHSLNEYLEKFSLPCQLLNSKERLECATYKLFLNLSKLNVIYAEVRFAPIKHIQENLTIDEVVVSVINGMERAKKEVGIEGGIIACCMRDSDQNDNILVVNTAKKYLGKGIVGIDLAGAEALYPTSNFEYIFVLAQQLNIPYTIHAGEADGISSIESAIKFGTKRIGHGVRSIEDINTIKELINKDILLEVCVTSNYQTEAIKGIHPIEKLYKLGVNISINTDNDTVSNINIIDEYKNILETTSLTIKDIVQCNYNSINYIFYKTIKDKIQKTYEDLFKLF